MGPSKFAIYITDLSQRSIHPTSPSESAQKQPCHPKSQTEKPLILHVQGLDQPKRGASSEATDNHSTDSAVGVTVPSTSGAGEVSFETSEDEKDDRSDNGRVKKTHFGRWRSHVRDERDEAADEVREADSKGGNIQPRNGNFL